MSLRVAHLLGRFPCLYERPILEEIAALPSEGIAPVVIAFRPSGDALPPGIIDAVGRPEFLDVCAGAPRWIAAAATLAAGFIQGGRAGDFRMRLRLSDVGRRGRLRRALRRDRPDVLHAQFGHLGLLALPVARSLGVPLVVSFRGQDVRLMRDAAESARRALFAGAARVLVRSRDMRSDLLALGAPEERLFVQPTGIDVAGWPCAERGAPADGESAVVLLAGRAVPKKGMEDGLRALARCRARPLVRVLGGGPGLPALRALAGELGLRARVQFAGPVAREDLATEMLRAHLFLLSCRTAPDGEKEGLPNVIKEAQATGLPVVSTRHAGIPECVEHGVSGLLSEEGDIDALAAHIDELLGHPERWPAMGAAGRRIVSERYDLRLLAPQLARHYDDVTAGVRC